jgi:hypothetical protein
MARHRTRAHWLLTLTVFALSFIAGSGGSQADWLSRLGLSRLGLSAEPSGASDTRTSARALEQATAFIKALPAAKPGQSVLAAQSSAEGHWTLINRTGETFTSANTAEFARGLPLLAPEAATANGTLALYLTEDSLFAGRAGLKDLPKTAQPHMVRGKDAYRLVMSGDRTTVHAEVRPGLIVEMTERHLFDEALYQLARPVSRSGVRVLALEPGGPPTLPSAPRLDSTGTRALVDLVDPAQLSGALTSLKGQTALITGRIDGELLMFQPTTGIERSIKTRDLIAAAESADVNLIVLRAASSRQPGGRNWLWQTIEVKGLDDALKSSTLADFLAGLSAGRGPVAITTARTGAMRASLELAPVRGGAASIPSVAEVSSKLTELAGNVTGHVAIQSLSAHLRSADRQQELDRRLIAGIPGNVQTVYGGLMILGLFGMGVSRQWWARIWPMEQRADYANGMGYWAAMLVRTGLYAFVFLPLTGCVSAVIAAVRQFYPAHAASRRADVSPKAVP